MNINYGLYSKFVGYTYINIQEKIYNKMIRCQGIVFNKISKEKMLNIIHSEVVTISDFGDILATRCADLLMVVIAIIIVFKINIIVGFIVILVSIINYLIINKINVGIAYGTKKKAEARDNLYEKFSDIVINKNMITDLDIKTRLKNEYLNKSKEYIKALDIEVRKKSDLDNKFFVFYNGMIYLITLFLVFLVTKNSINVTLYFMVVSYLASAIETTLNFMSIIQNIKNVNIANMRINTILNLDEREILQYGNNKSDNIEGSINFNNVSYVDSDKKSPYHKAVSNINFNIENKTINLFYGKSNSGKRTIFYLIRRIVKPNTGKIYVSDIEINEFSEKIYKSNINFTTAKPLFFNTSIIKNLKYVEKNKSKIFEVCNNLEIHEFINNFPQKYNTNINNKIISEEKKFLISLARAILSNSEIILIYEVPKTLTLEEEEKLRKILLKLKSQKTIILFTANYNYSKIADNTYVIEEGQIKESTEVLAQD